MSGIKGRSTHGIPYVREIEKIAVELLKEDPHDKDRLKEMLDDYAGRYAREYSAGA
ncbi:hypothetical protein J7L18_07425 [Candidatus Bathyarchaeota archaeon]|nr:hypothetical protein [Candidatus Bathyarchaeota archaeon]